MNPPISEPLITICGKDMLVIFNLVSNSCNSGSLSESIIISLYLICFEFNKFLLNVQNLQLAILYISIGSCVCLLACFLGFRLDA